LSSEIEKADADSDSNHVAGHSDPERSNDLDHSADTTTHSGQRREQNDHSTEGGQKSDESSSAGITSHRRDPFDPL
jgi:hypothetical protein